MKRSDWITNSFAPLVPDVIIIDSIRKCLYFHGERRESVVAIEMHTEVFLELVKSSQITSLMPIINLEDSPTIFGINLILNNLLEKDTLLCRVKQGIHTLHRIG